MKLIGQSFLFAPVVLMVLACGGAGTGGQADMGTADADATAWDALSAAMPRNLSAIQARLDEFAAGAELPPSLGAGGLEAVRGAYAAAVTGWEEAQAKWTAGDHAGALDAAEGLKVSVTQAMTSVGLTVDDQTWSNVQSVPQ